MTCPMCHGDDLAVAFSYDAPPPGETRFDLTEGQRYSREYLRCAACGHYVGRTELDLDAALYSGAYMDSTYGESVERTYERIMALPPEASDNAQRVRRIDARWPDGVRRTALDVGSGLGVFPARMKAAGWEVTALDPDPAAVKHVRERVGVTAICADFMAVEPDRRYALVAFNKVLEHVRDPRAMLARSRRFLEVDGAVYLELPDAEAAAADPAGKGREEFFIEHLHAFSMASLCLLAQHAGFRVDSAERLREPSGKYTLVAFLSAARGESQPTRG